MDRMQREESVADDEILTLGSVEPEPEAIQKRDESSKFQTGADLANVQDGLEQAGPGDRSEDESSHPDLLLDALAAQIEQQLQHGDPSIARVARRLAMSPRTLQRRLCERNTSFLELKFKVQLSVARTLLQEQHGKVSDVSLLVGYSEPSAFCRAFKRWTGMAPGRFRSRPPVLASEASPETRTVAINAEPIGRLERSPWAPSKSRAEGGRHRARSATTKA